MATAEIVLNSTLGGKRPPVWRHVRIAGSLTIPPTSAARSTPVRLPNPNFVQVEWRIEEAVRTLLSRPSATLAATTLRDQAIPSSKVSQPIALWSASSMWVRPLSSMRMPVSLIFVLVVTVRVSRPAIAVSILNTDPGSYTELTTGSMKRFGSTAATA